ncbi:hypothetical protein Tco_1281735, partial [Tanacetum coccineum]
VPDELNLKSSNKRAGVTLEVPDEPSDDSSSSGNNSKFAVEDISSDEDEVTKKADGVKKADVEKDTDEQVAEEQVAKKQTRDEKHGADKGDNEPVGDAQFLNENAEVNLFDILKDPVEPKVQSMVDVPVKQAKLAALRPPLVDITVILIPDTTTTDNTSLENRVYRLERWVDVMSRFNIQEAVDESVEAHLKQIDLSKDIPDFFKIKQEKAAKQSMPKHTINIQHIKLLFNTLAVSLSVDEEDIDKLADPPLQKKRQRNDHDKDPSLEEKEGS